MKKLRVTEEFLWRLYEFVQVAGEMSYTMLTRGYFKEEFRNEWQELQHIYEKKQQKRSFTQFLSYLKGKGYIKIPSGVGVGHIQLTQRGIQKALRGRAQERAFRKRKDGKMIMLMFDIPKEKEGVRWAFRNALGLLDYQMLQKSVWISDKDVLEETESAIRECDLHSCVNMFVIEKVQVQK